MFKVINKVLKVFNHEVVLEDGVHQIYYNAKTDNIAVDNQGKDFIKIAEYSYSAKDKKLTIKDNLDKVPKKKSFHLSRILANSVGNNARIGMGPLWGEHGINSDTIQTFLEGIPVDFNYTSFFASSIQLSNYTWAGGRVCNSSLFFSDSNDAKPWTAVPASGSCISPMVGVFLAGQMMTLNPLFGINAMAADANNWVANSTSLVYQPYVFRRYTMLQINDINLFSFFVGGKEIKVSPLKLEDDSMSVPDVNWKMSTFNLIQ